MQSRKIRHGPRLDYDTGSRRGRTNLKWGYLTSST